MKKILSTILTTVMLATPMVTANCFADEPAFVSESMCETSTSCDSKSSKVSKVIATVGAITAGLVSAVLLKEFAPNGELGLHVKKGFNVISGAVVPYFTQAKESLLNYFLNLEKEQECTASFMNAHESLKKFWETNSVIVYLAEVKNAVANNFNPPVER